MILHLINEYPIIKFKINTLEIICYNIFLIKIYKI